MNRKNIVIVIALLIIILAMGIYISYLKGYEKGQNSNDKIKTKKSDILCIGEYINNTERYIIYENGTYTRIYDGGSEEGKFKISKDILTFKYYDLDSKSDIEYTIIESKDCSYIEKGSIKYTKLKD